MTSHPGSQHTSNHLPPLGPLLQNTPRTHLHTRPRRVLSRARTSVPAASSSGPGGSSGSASSLRAAPPPTTRGQGLADTDRCVPCRRAASLQFQLARWSSSEGLSPAVFSLQVHNGTKVGNLINTLQKASRRNTDMYLGLANCHQINFNPLLEEKAVYHLKVTDKNNYQRT